MLTHKTEYGIYHWDTFDNETILIGNATTIEEAEEKVKDRYGGRIRPDGADRVDIVDKSGNVVRVYSVG